MKPWVQWVLLPVALATLATCTLVEDTCACSSIAPAVVVVGQASDSTGLPLDGVVVGLTVQDQSCTTDLAPPLSVVTDSTGAYVLYQDGLDEGIDVCGHLEGLRFSDTAVDTVRVVGIPLSVGFGDAYEANLVFPPRTEG